MKILLLMLSVFFVSSIALGATPKYAIDLAFAKQFSSDYNKKVSSNASILNMACIRILTNKPYEDCMVIQNQGSKANHCVEALILIKYDKKSPISGVGKVYKRTCVQANKYIAELNKAAKPKHNPLAI